MDLSAIVNQDEGLVLPRRSSSNAHAIPQPSPVSASSKMPTPTPTPRAKQAKSKRHEPKPIWAYREGEELPEELQRLQEQQRQQARPPPPPLQPPAQHQAGVPAAQRMPPRPAPGPPAAAAAAAPNGIHELAGYERPVSDDAVVYDGVSREVCQFIFSQAIMNPSVRAALDASPQTQLEVEARWGQIIDSHTGKRLNGYNVTECVIRPRDVKFESTMTMEQHKKMNMYLNSQVQASMPGAGNRRPQVKYQHTREVDQFYELGQEERAKLPQEVQALITESEQRSGRREKLRVSRDEKTGEVLRRLIKVRIANLEISSPQTEWDYRIGINLEINFPGDGTENLEPSKDSGQRRKDRMSYSWLGAYQVDLTQVQQGPNGPKNHELELELDSGVLLGEAEKNRRNVGDCFEPLINGMLNNLRVLSREITPAVPERG
ncbi:mRNA-capping enzyme subunit beta [Curvularia kusanoi]|uniref:mRNA-capping enzyme subunit beta n=1 Tax=Curvularia kusanoi TaxID=90978 RepID=A0A9P4W930_CURKU|nr:mRNA-capping enzyme subunit beta [Curvularia kusanoi]